MCILPDNNDVINGLFCELDIVLICFIIVKLPNSLSPPQPPPHPLSRHAPNSIPKRMAYRESIINTSHALHEWIKRTGTL